MLGTVLDFLQKLSHAAFEIIGREDELERVTRFLDASPVEAPRALVLEGEAGIGKSTLWLEGLVVARDLRSTRGKQASWLR